MRADCSFAGRVVPEMWVGDADARVAGRSSTATAHKEAKRILTPPGQRRKPAENHSNDDRWSTYEIYKYMCQISRYVLLS